jgi:hypothetical protein
MIKLKQQLTLFYRSRSIFNSYMIKSKHILLYLIILMLITFIFNKNIVQFKDLNIYNINYISFIFNGVLLYITYVKFNILVRVISFIKSIKYFYNQIKLNRIKNIKSIAIYYYLLNTFLMVISLLFVNNIHNNISSLHLESYIEFTNLISIILLLFYSIYIITMEFNIIETNNNINPLIIVINILILFIPFITINFYYDKINIFDNIFTIHCDSKGSSSFETKIKENPSIVITNNSNSIINNPNSKIYINTPKDIGEDKTFNTSTSSDTNQDPLNKLVIEINNFKDLNSKFISLFIKSLTNKDIKLDFNDDYYNKFINKSQTKYKIDSNIIKFFKSNVELLSSLQNKYIINNKDILSYVEKLYEIETEHKNKLYKIKQDYDSEIEGLELIKEFKYNKLMDALYDYTNFKDEVLPSINQKLLDNYLKEFTKLDDNKDKLINNEMNNLINKINNRNNNLDKIYNNTLDSFNKNIDSNSNSPKFNNFIYPEDANLDKFKDLFTKPKPK